MQIVFHDLTKAQQSWVKNNHSRLRIKFVNGELTAKKLPADTEILSVHTNCHIDQELLSHLKNLRLLITRTTGVDHIDLVAARQQNVKVANLPGQNALAVAEFSLGLMLSASRSIVPASASVKPGQWEDDSWYGNELFNKTLGVVGTGAIGSHVLKLAKAFGMKLLAHDYKKNKTLARKLGFSYVTLKELFRRSDIISLHIPGTPLTKHLVNRQLLSAMKPGAGIVNTARGSLIDTKALWQVLQKGRMGWYAADVLENELDFSRATASGLSAQDKQVRQINSQLVKHPRVVITPHMAHASEEASQRILEQTLKVVTDFKNGKRVKTII